MRVTRTLLSKMQVGAAAIDTHLEALRLWLPAYEIDTPLRIAHFLAQVLHESGRLTRLEENLRYSSARLLVVFPKYFTPAQARAYANQPRRIGSRVYANRLGNGNEASGDGWLYRGRGLIQITGRDHYRAFSDFVGVDVERTPGLVATRFPVVSAVYFWELRAINALADRDDLRAVTRQVHGALGGLAERRALLVQLKRHLGLAVARVA